VFSLLPVMVPGVSCDFEILNTSRMLILIGISQSLGTGLVLSELLENQPTSADINGLGI